MSAKPIGVFDSGIGGLTVVHSLMQRLPHENIVYFGDTARVPYGPKSAQVVREYAAQDTDFLLAHDVKMVVVACNTVSAVALDVVQKHARVPVVGVIMPGAGSAVQATRNKRVGVIGTATTITSGAYANAIRQLDRSVYVVGKACPLFVPLVEEGWTSHSVTEIVAREYLFPFTLERIDTLVLGCTHYPLLKPVLGKVLGEGVTLVDSAEATAEEVERILNGTGLRNKNAERANTQFFLSDLPHKFAEIGERFLGRTLGRVRRAAGFQI